MYINRYKDGCLKIGLVSHVVAVVTMWLNGYSLYGAGDSYLINCLYNGHLQGNDSVMSALQRVTCSRVPILNVIGNWPRMLYLILFEMSFWVQSGVERTFL